MTTPPRKPDPKVAHVDDELLPSTPEQTRYYLLQQDPYAKLSVAIPGDGVTAGEALAKAAPSLKAATMAEFDAECRRILEQYIPASEKGRLRPHHRQFISRNRVRSSSGRYKILRQLRKYDFSDRAGVTARFNRERDELTETKLREIERAVDEGD